MWRVIPLAPRDPYVIAAAEEVLLESSAAGGESTIVLNQWSRPAISISVAQSLNDINAEACMQKGYCIVRTRVGGRAVVHHPNWGITYIVGESPNNYPAKDRNPQRMYDIYCGKIDSALRSLGISTELRNKNDLFVAGRKISGNAQKIDKNAMVQSGIILYEKPSASEMLELMTGYNMNGDKHALEKLLTGVTDHSGASREEVAQSLVSSFTEGKEWRIGDWTQEENARINDLISERYSDPEWNKGDSKRGLCWLPKFQPLGTYKGENPD